MKNENPAGSEVGRWRGRRGRRVEHLE